MGWTGSPLDHSRPITAQEAFAAEFSTEFCARVIATAKKGTSIYAAVRTPDGKDVFGMVLYAETATSRWAGQRGRTLYTKGVDETQGPGDYDCPRRILDLLTDTDDERAIAWRAECRARLSRPTPNHGDFVLFDEPFALTDGTVRDLYVFRRRSSFSSADGRGDIRLARWRDRGHTILPAPQGQVLAYAERTYIAGGYALSGQIGHCRNIDLAQTGLGDSDYTAAITALVDADQLQRRDTVEPTYELPPSRRVALIERHDLSEAWQQQDLVDPSDPRHGEIPHAYRDAGLPWPPVAAAA